MCQQLVLQFKMEVLKQLRSTFHVYVSEIRNLSLFLAAQIALLSHINSRGVVCPVHIKDKNGEEFTVQQIPDSK